MPLDVGKAINNFTDKFLNSQFINSVAKNPIYTSLAITVIIVFVIMFIFRDAETEDSLFTMCLRSGFWIFLLMTGVLVLHNKILYNETNQKEKIGAMENVFNIGYSGYDADSNMNKSSVVPVELNANFDNIF